MIRVAVVAHSGKRLDGGLPELRLRLAERGHRAPLWYEVPKSKRAPRMVRRALKEGATLIFVWGGDGMVQRTIDALAGHDEVALAIVPAGTANLFATNLGIPKTVAGAVDVGLRGARRKLDVGVIRKERFAVMAGTGFDARMIRAVNGVNKRRLGRLAYFRSAIKAMQARRARLRVLVDGASWWKGSASCVLVGNVGTVTAGLHVFPQASPSDGLLDVAVVTAKSAWQWLRLLSRLTSGRVDRSPFVELARGKKIVVELERAAPYEVDGGARDPARRLKVRIEPAALTVCLPRRRGSP